jgi:hypothetical protein
MRLYWIAAEEVRYCVEQLDETAPTGTSKRNYYRRRNGGWLRVTAVTEGSDLVIIA